MHVHVELQILSVQAYCTSGLERLTLSMRMQSLLLISVCIEPEYFISVFFWPFAHWTRIVICPELSKMNCH